MKRKIESLKISKNDIAEAIIYLLNNLVDSNKINEDIILDQIIIAKKNNRAFNNDFIDDINTKHSDTFWTLYNNHNESLSNRIESIML
jgi:lipopolysaccharide export LptBFGC system permease protein LptF